MKVAVCGIGNRIRGDDGVGPEVVSELRRDIGEAKDVLILDCEEKPESILGDLQRFSPDKLIIVDAVDLGKEPGTIGIVDIHSVKKQAMSTHKLPLNMFIDYLQTRMKFKLVFIGVQPKEICYNTGLSEECRNAVPFAKELVKQHI